MIGVRMGMCDSSNALMMCGISCKASSYFILKKIHDEWIFMKGA
jgi:hypothetical protein